MKRLDNSRDPFSKPQMSNMSSMIEPYLQVQLNMLESVLRHLTMVPPKGKRLSAEVQEKRLDSPISPIKWTRCLQTLVLNPIGQWKILDNLLFKVRLPQSSRKVWENLMKQSESLSKSDTQSQWKKVNRSTAIRKEALEWVKWDKVMIRAAKSKWLYRRKTNLSLKQKGNLTMVMSLSLYLSLNLESQPIAVHQKVNKPQREKAKHLLRWAILKTSMRAKHQKATAEKSVISQERDSRMMD